MTKALFTDTAIVKVFAHTTFVADSKDRSLATAIALDIVHRTFFDNGFFLLFKIKILAGK